VRIRTFVAATIAFTICEIFPPAAAMGQTQHSDSSTAQPDNTKVKTEKMAMYPNLSFKAIFPMPTWFGYVGNWEAISLSGNDTNHSFLVQANRQIPYGFSVDMTFSQPLDGTGTANLWLAKKFFGDMLSLGGAFSTAKPISQAGWTMQITPIYNDRNLLAFGVQASGIGGKATTKGAMEARREVGSGRIIGFGGYAVLTGENMTEFGGSVGGALKGGKGARINIGTSAKKKDGKFTINEITLGLQVPTKRYGTPFDTRLTFSPKGAFNPKGRKFNAALYWTLPQKTTPKAGRTLPQKVIR